jgi:hypothetical protein
MRVSSRAVVCYVQVLRSYARICKSSALQPCLKHSALWRGCRPIADGAECPAELKAQVSGVKQVMVTISLTIPSCQAHQSGWLNTVVMPV